MNFTFCNPNSIFAPTYVVRQEVMFSQVYACPQGRGGPPVTGPLSLVLSCGAPPRLDMGYLPPPPPQSLRRVPTPLARDFFVKTFYILCNVALSSLFIDFIHRICCTCNTLKLSLLCKKEVKYRLLLYLKLTWTFETFWTQLRLYYKNIDHKCMSALKKWIKFRYGTDLRQIC